MRNRRTPGARRWLGPGAVAALGLLSACMSGRTFRGTQHPEMRRPEAGRERARHPTCRGDSQNDVWAERGFCVTRVAGDLDRPRHLVVAPNGDLFVATRRGVAVLWDADGDGESEARERAIVGARDLSNQGIAFSPDGAWLYYAGDRFVRRFAYRDGQRAFEGTGELVIPDLPVTITHPYKTLTFDREGRLYVMVGSLDNLHAGDGAVIMRYAVPAQIPQGGVAYASGERFAVGIRNAEALAWDPDGRLWAFVNGRDYLRPPGTPETFYFDHPGDQIFRLSPNPNTFYGFPHCWTLGPVAWEQRTDPASHWADPDRHEGRDDAWCQNATNVHPAAGTLRAHSAPLGAVFYTGTLFPEPYRNNLFVTAHGSWNRPGAHVGRIILRVVLDGERVARVEPFVGERRDGGALQEGRWRERPVGIAQGRDGALYFTSDETGHVFRVGYFHE